MARCFACARKIVRKVGAGDLAAAAAAPTAAAACDERTPKPSAPVHASIKYAPARLADNAPRPLSICIIALLLD